MKKIFSNFVSLCLILIFHNSCIAQEIERSENEQWQDEQAGRVMDKIIFKNASLIDLATGEVKSDMSLIVRHEKIKLITKTAELTEQHLKNALIKDVKGAYLIPGLIDSHIHLTQGYSDKGFGKKTKGYFSRYIYGGITAVRDMWGDGRAAANFSRQTYMNEYPAPDFYFSALMAGTGFFADFGEEAFPAGYGVKSGKAPWAQEIKDDTDIALAVAMARGTGATGIKLYADLTKTQIEKIIREADRQGILIWSHAQVYPATPFDVLDGTTVSHTGEITKYVVAEDKTTYNPGDPADYRKIKLEEIIDNQIFKDYTIKAREKGVLYEPTLSLHATWDEGKKRRTNPFRGLNPSRELGGGMVNALQKGGVKILAGSDALERDVIPFPRLYKELEVLVEFAGLSPREALVAATIHGAESLGKTDEFGSIEIGKYANLMFMSQNPLDDIANLKSVVLTVKRGKQFPRDEYVHFEN